MREILSSAPLSIAQRDDLLWREQSICWQSMREADATTKDDPIHRSDYEECRTY